MNCGLQRLRNLSKEEGENTEQPEITEHPEGSDNQCKRLRLFRYFRLFRSLASSWPYCLLSSLCNQALAKRHWRMTVAVPTSSTAAVSSIERPPK